MKRQLCSLVFAALTLCLIAVQGLGKDSSELVKRHERNTVSLDLEFAKKNPNALQRVISFLNWGPNGFATGFVVGDHLVMTAYHVVSGDLDESKKLALGFSRTDELEARVFTNGCQAKVLGVDVNADLALLEVCGTPKQTVAPSFQLTLNKDEKLMLIARPHGDRVISRGTFYGAYSLKGVDYWSVKINARDGFSGSPVYNEKGEVVGVFSGYDWAQRLAVISPGLRAQKLLADFAPSAKP